MIDSIEIVWFCPAYKCNAHSPQRTKVAPVREPVVQFALRTLSYRFYSFKVSGKMDKVRTIKDKPPSLCIAFFLQVTEGEGFCRIKFAYCIISVF
jgi:hypothetical protein